MGLQIISRSSYGSLEDEEYADRVGIDRQIDSPKKDKQINKTAGETDTLSSIPTYDLSEQ